MDDKTVHKYSPPSGRKFVQICHKPGASGYSLILDNRGQVHKTATNFLSYEDIKVGIVKSNHI
jgi:hypothetical protein